MLDLDRIADLKRMYTLFLRVPEDVGRRTLRQALKNDIEERGKGINEGGVINPGGDEEGGEDEEMDGKAAGKGKGKGKERAGAGAGALMLALRWVQEVLDLKDKFDRVLEEAFGGDKAVQTSINEVSLTHPTESKIWIQAKSIGISIIH